MKKSFFNDLFLSIKPRFRRELDGALLDHPKIQQARSPFFESSPTPAKRPGLNGFPAAVLFAVTTALLLLGFFFVQRQNRSLNEENQQNKNKIEAIQKEKQNLDQAIEKLKGETQSLAAQLKKTEDNLTSINEEKTYLEEILIHKTKEIERMKQGGAVSPTLSVVPASADIEQRLARKDEELQRLTEQNAILSKKLDKLYKTTNDKISEINVAKITLEETISEARKAIENEWKTVDLGTISAGGNTGQKTKAVEAKRTPKNQGKVLAVNETHGFVVVDLGKTDGLNDETLLSLSQNGESIATLKVLEIRDAMTACNIKDLTAGKKIQVNDLVLIQK